MWVRVDSSLSARATRKAISAAAAARRNVSSRFHYCQATGSDRSSRYSERWLAGGRGTAEQRIKEGKNPVKWTRLSCHDFVNNQVRLQLFALAYNLANYLRRLALPSAVKHWTMTTLREKLVKIGAKVVRRARYLIFQMAEVAIPRRLFAAILERIQRLRRPTVGVVSSG